MADGLIKANGLRKEYDEVVALENLDLEVKAGEILGLLGPNGAGKTTALRMIASILTPTSGSASICGYDCHKEVNGTRKTLALRLQTQQSQVQAEIPQSRSKIPKLVRKHLISHSP